MTTPDVLDGAEIEPCIACGALPIDMIAGQRLTTEAWSEAAVGFAMQYVPRCRECADEDGACPVTHMSCDQREKATRFIIGALTYGIENGFLDVPSLARTRRVVDARMVNGES